MSPVLGVLVSVALALGPAPTRLSGRFEELRTQVQDLAEQKKYRELALAGVAAFERRDLEPYQRREMAFFAIRGLHGMFEETGQVSSLCDARRLMRRVERAVGFAEDQSTADRLRRATAKHLAASGVKDPCGEPRKAKKTAPALAARSAPTKEPAPVEPDTARDTSSPSAAAAPEPPPPLLGHAPPAVGQEARPSASPIVQAGPKDSTPTETRPRPAAAPEPSAPSTKTGRPLVIVGSLALVGGLGLAAAAAYRGVHLHEIVRDARALGEAIDGFATPAQLEHDTALRSEYRQVGGQVLALALTGGATVVLGAVLAGIGGRRMVRTAPRTALLPSPGGVALRIRF